MLEAVHIYSAVVAKTQGQNVSTGRPMTDYELNMQSGCFSARMTMTAAFFAEVEHLESRSILWF